MRDKLILWYKYILFLFALLVLAIIFSLSTGSVAIPIRKVIRILFFSEQGIEYSIIFHIRFPRILLALAVGGALSISGVIFQSMFRNPLVEPYTLGVSGGAALAVSFCIVLGLGMFIPIAGFIGALASILFVSIVSMRTKTLLLTGVMISFISSSLVMFLMAVAGNEELHRIVFWIMGSLEEPNVSLIKMVSVLIAIVAFISILFSNILNALSLGEEEAMHLGINVEIIKKILFILTSLLIGLSISVTGIIGFVGLAVPSFMRILVGSDHRILIVSSFISGGIFLLLCDTLARTIISPMELPVGVITGIIGGIVFILLLTYKRTIK